MHNNLKFNIRKWFDLLYMYGILRFMGSDRFYIKFLLEIDTENGEIYKYLNIIE